MCGTMCKCVGCKNCEENSGSMSLMRLADVAMVKTVQSSNSERRLQDRRSLKSPTVTNSSR